MTPIYINDEVAFKLFDLCKKLKFKVSDVVAYTTEKLDEYYKKVHVNEFWDD